MRAQVTLARMAALGLAITPACARRKALVMFKTAFLIFTTAVAAVTVVVLVYVLGAPMSAVLAVGLGALSLFWLLVLLTVPWNLYFQARRLLSEIRASRERGIEVQAGREGEADRIRRRMALVAVGGHLLSAGTVATVTYFSAVQAGYYFAAFYLISTLFRPAAAYFAQLRERLATMTHEVKYPREDVAELRSRVERMEKATKSVQDRITQLTAQQNRLGRRFDADSQEVMTGLRTFVRLMAAGPSHTPTRIDPKAR
jgi:hypothetical protein